MADLEPLEFSRADRLAVVAIVIGLAGALGPLFLPQSILAAVPDSIRAGVAILCGMITVCALIFLMWDWGRSYRKARVCLYCTILLVTWGVDLFFFNTMPIWGRGIVGAVSGAFVLILAPMIFQANSPPSTPREQQPPTKSTPGATMFDLSDGAKASVGELQTRGDAVSIAKMAGGSTLIIGRTSVFGPNAPPIELPQLSPEWAILSNEELKQRLTDYSKRLRAFGEQIANNKSDIDKKSGFERLRGSDRASAMNRAFAETTQYDRETDAVFHNEYFPEILKCIASLVQRGKDIQVPPAIVSSGFDEYKRAKAISIGASHVQSGYATGSYSEVADYLEFLASKT